MLNWDANTLTLMQEESIKQAEKDHLAQEVIEESRKVNPNYNPTLAWVGRRVADIGIKLMQMSGSDEDKRALHDAEIHLN